MCHGSMTRIVVAVVVASAVASAHSIQVFLLCCQKQKEQKQRQQQKKMAKKLLNKRALRVGIFSVVAASATKVGQVDRATTTTR